MPDFGRAAPDQPDLEAAASTDRFLDALAERRPVEFSDPGDEVLAALLEEWRDELRWPPASGLVSQGEAVAALRSGAAARRRTRRGLAVVGSLAATVLCLGGFGAMVANAHPGDALYGLHTMLFGEPEVSDDQIVLAAKTELDQVQQMIVQGQWDQAQDKLAAISNTVQTVNDANRKQDLIDQVKLLNTKVATRDPNATLPPSLLQGPQVPAGPAPPSASVTLPAPASEPSIATTSPPPSSLVTATTTATETSPATTSLPPAWATTSPSSAATSPASATTTPASSPAPSTPPTAAATNPTSATTSAPDQPPSPVASVTPTTAASPPSGG